MANATINGWVLDINPSEASWSYKLLTNSQDTYGGRVIQILSCRIDSFTIKGHLSCKGTGDRQWARMEEFEGKIKKIMAYHANNKKPVPFRFDVLDWSGDVYLTGYSNVEYNPKTSAISYTLAFTVDSGFDSISQEVSDSVKASLGNVKSGINYVRNVYNTPTNEGWKQVKDALKKAIGDSGNFNTETKSIYEYISELSSGGSESSDTGSNQSDQTSNGSNDNSYSNDDSSNSNTGSWFDNIVKFFTGGN